ncbi:transmembrane protein [Perilla frutescens var. hirtella]|uniref:Transmembrane protein n=1 Tax=Perilla frutescens var. hirtella TaxID=608512 RepID=A0AAD4JJ53_PERFH|nr:transmembrane protein [Perilla frutescens var. hirtella]
MVPLIQISFNFSAIHPLPKYSDSSKKLGLYKLKFLQPINYSSASRIKIKSFHVHSFRADASREKLQFLGVGRVKDGISVSSGRRAVLVKFNNGFNGLGGGGGGGGGGRVNGETARVVGNLALAILLTYLSMTGQLGWLLDAIVSLWLLAVLVPIVGIGAFLWWAGRDIVQGNCPNCGNEFQVFKSTLNNDLQLCPFCTQPFSVEGDEFVRDPVTFSNQSTIFDQAFNDFSPRAKKGKDSSLSVVDVEAEIRDAE